MPLFRGFADEVAITRYAMELASTSYIVGIRFPTNFQTLSFAAIIGKIADNLIDIASSPFCRSLCKLSLCL